MLFLLGIVLILLGIQGFTGKGVPLTRSKNLTGTAAQVVGGICVALGGLICLGAFAWRVMREMAR